MYKIGDLVRILPPFNSAYPEVYAITGIRIPDEVYQILDERDFDVRYLEPAE